MKRSVVTLASTLLCLTAGNVFADAHEAAPDLPNIVPVETWTCELKDGKTFEDFQEVTADWNDWMDDREIDDYFAAIVLPNYFGEIMFDVGWLGAWKDGNAMGSGTDMWIAENGEVGESFNELCTWESHTNFASMNIKPPPEDEDDDKSFVLTFSNCSVNDGKNFEDLMGAVNAWAAHATEHGFQHSIWMMFPVYGESNNDYNFKMLEGHDDHAALGADYELMGNGGHWVKNSEILDPVMNCDIPRLYDAMTVRDWAEDE